jgi:hypothetical protein
MHMVGFFGAFAAAKVLGSYFDVLGHCGGLGDRNTVLPQTPLGMSKWGCPASVTRRSGNDE